MSKSVARVIGAVAVILVASTSLVLSAASASADLPPTVTVAGNPTEGSAVTATLNGGADWNTTADLFACTVSGTLTSEDLESALCTPVGTQPLDADWSTTWQVPTGHVGAYLYANVHDLGDGDIVSAPFGPIVAGSPVNQTLPTITGDPVMYGTLTGDNGTWTPEADSYSYQWLRCDIEGANCQDIEDRVSTTYQLGSIWWDGGVDVGSTIRFRVTAHNTAGDTVALSAATTVIPAPVLTPIGDALTDSELTFTWTGGDSEHASFDDVFCSTPDITSVADLADCVWDGQGLASSGFTIPPGYSGQYLYFVAKSYLAAPIGPIDAPVAGGQPTIAGSALVGATLNANVGLWLPARGMQYVITWQRCDAEGGSCATILDGVSGHTGATYAVTGADVGSTIRIEVRGTNRYGSASATSSTTATITQPPAPQNTDVPTISGTAHVGQTLTANAGTWTNADEYAYQWQRCTVTCTDIVDADASTYALGDEDVDTRLRVAVTASGLGGTTEATSLETVPVAGDAPQITIAPIITGDAVDGETLAASPGTWTGTGTITFTYQWLRCTDAHDPCAAITDATAPTYELTTADVGSMVRVQVTGSNAVGDQAAVSEPTAAAAALPSGGLGSSATTDGGTITVSGDDFAPDSDVDVTLHSDPVHLGTVPTDAEGHFTAMFAIPAGTPTGNHHVVLTGLDAAGRTAIVTLTITIQAATNPTTPADATPVAPADPAAPAAAPTIDRTTPSANPNGSTTTGTLPTTGSQVGGPLVLGMAATVLGAACLLGARRIRRAGSRAV